MQSNLEHKPRLERRRVQVIGRLVVDVGKGCSETCLCNTLNMSLSGVLVETGSELAVGSILRYTFSLPGVRRIMEITGEVMRRSTAAAAVSGRGDGEGADALGGDDAAPGVRSAEVVGDSRGPAEPIHWYGIKFLELTDEDRDDMERFLLG